jgi:methylphosphotriester-DNA--protein-cysteine methyltransferase
VVGDCPDQQRKAQVEALASEEPRAAISPSGASVPSSSVDASSQDTTSFHRLFKRLAVMAPAQYRRKFRLPSFFEAAGEQSSRHIAQ